MEAGIARRHHDDVDAERLDAERLAHLAEAVALAEVVDRPERMAHPVAPFLSSMASIVRRSPSSKPTRGSYPIAARAAETSAHDSRTSPGCAGPKVFSTGRSRSRPTVSASALTVSEPPVATFRTVPAASGRVGREQVRRDDVLDVGEVARLLAVAVDGDGPALGDRADEPRHDRRILRGRVLAAPEDVEVPQRDGLDPVHPREADAEPLRSELGDGVGGDRVRRLRLDAWERSAVAVDGRRRRGHDAPDPLVPGSEQHVERALDVDRGRRQRVLHRARHGAQRALVEDDLDAADGRVHALVRAEVALDHLDVPPELCEVRPAAGREVVQHADVVASLEERLDEVRADEAGAAGDEDARHAGRSATTW